MTSPSLSAKPALQIGDRVFSHYTMRWGFITGIAVERREQMRGGEPCGTFTTWWWMTADNGTRDMLDDADGDWEMARVVPQKVALRYGYGPDPLARQTGEAR